MPYPDEKFQRLIEELLKPLIEGYSKAFSDCEKAANLLLELPETLNDANKRKYPSIKIIFDLAEKLRHESDEKYETISNKETEINSSATDENYPSSKAVYEMFDRAVQAAVSQAATITFDNADIAEVSTNLFDKNAEGIVVGRYLLSNTGEEIEDETCVISDYIAVENDSTYSTRVNYDLFRAQAIYVALYDSEKNYIGYATGELGSVTNTYSSELTFTVSNEDAAYVRITIHKDYVNTHMLVAGDIYPDEYIEYGLKLNKDVIIPQLDSIEERIERINSPVYNDKLNEEAVIENTTSNPTLFPCKKTGVWFDYRNNGSFRLNANLDCYIFKASEGDRFNISGLEMYEAFGDQYFVVPVSSTFETVGEVPVQNTTFGKWCGGVLSCPADTSYLIINVLSETKPTVTDVSEAILPPVNGILSNAPKFLKEQTNSAGYPMYYAGSVGNTISSMFKENGEQKCFGLFPLESEKDYTVFIPESGTTSMVNLFFLDSEFRIINQVLDNAFVKNKYEFTAQDEIAYVAINCFDLDSGVQLGLTRSDQIKQGAKIGNAFFDGSHDLTLGDIGVGVKSLNLKWVAYGDSITYQNTWQPLIVSKYNITDYVNKGEGGIPLAGTGSNAMCSESKLSALVNEAPDVVTILGGANDLMTTQTGIPIGSVEDIKNKNRATFKGAYAYIIDYILTRLPSCRICLMGMYRAAYNNGSENPTNGSTITVTYDDYNEATKDIANYFSLPFVDLNECGFNSYTFNNTSNTVLSKQYDYIHPNEEGGKRIAGAVEKFFSTIFE